MGTAGQSNDAELPSRTGWPQSPKPNRDYFPEFEEHGHLEWQRHRNVDKRSAYDGNDDEVNPSLGEC